MPSRSGLGAVSFAKAYAADLGEQELKRRAEMPGQAHEALSGRAHEALRYQAAETALWAEDTESAPSQFERA